MIWAMDYFIYFICYGVRLTLNGLILLKVLIKTKLIIASYHPENPVNPLIIEKIFFSSCEVINMHRLHATKTMLDQSGNQGLLDP